MRSSHFITLVPRLGEPCTTGLCRCLFCYPSWIWDVLVFPRTCQLDRVFFSSAARPAVSSLQAPSLSPPPIRQYFYVVEISRNYPIPLTIELISQFMPKLPTFLLTIRCINYKNAYFTNCRMVHMDLDSPSRMGLTLLHDGGFKSWTNGKEGSPFAGRNKAIPSSTSPIYIWNWQDSYLGSWGHIPYSQPILCLQILCSCPDKISRGCLRSCKKHLTLILLSALVSPQTLKVMIL